MFGETVAIDNTSLRGGKAATLSRSELVAGWRGALEGLDVTQHLIGNHQVHVEDDDVTCLAYFKRSTGLRRRRGPALHAGWAI